MIEEPVPCTRIATDGSPSELRQACIRNGLLRALAPDDFALLAPHLRAIDVRLREDLIVADRPVTRCHFPESGVASVVARHDGTEIEVGLVGREGLIGAAPVLLGDDRSPHTHFVQIDGRMLAIAAPALRDAVARSRSLQHMLLRYVQTHLIQVAQTAYAQAALDLESRLARWLLMCHDRVDGDALLLTHEFLSIMLGVQRTGVTLALQNLEGAGLIRNRRKRIEILDRARLEALTNGAYGVPEAAYRRLIGPV